VDGMPLIDRIPLWVIFIISAIIVLIAIEAGYRLESFTSSRRKDKDKIPIGTIVQSTLGLLAFVMAFTFGVAAERFNDRRVLIIEEANAIGTTFLRADFLPDTNRFAVQNLLREYLDERLQLHRDVSKTSNKLALIAQAIKRSEHVQDLLWAQAIAVGKAKLDSNVFALFTESLNETINLQRNRVSASLYARLPDMIWVSLFLLMFLGMAGIGYEFGEANARSWTATAIASFSFALVVLIIADLERPTEGFLVASQQPLFDLIQRLGPKVQAPAPPP